MLNNYIILNSVLQPPGGHSSFSIGGYDSSANHWQDSNKSRRMSNNITSTKSTHANSADSLDQLVGSVGCSIPGLQTHYGIAGGKQSNNRVVLSDVSRQYQRDDGINAIDIRDSNGMNTRRYEGRGPIGKMDPKEYAAELRRQIENKRLLDMQDSENDYRRSRHQSDLRRKSEDIRSFDEGYSYHHNHSTERAGARKGNRSQQPPGGRSQLSLGWI